MDEKIEFDVQADGETAVVSSIYWAVIYWWVKHD